MRMRIPKSMFRIKGGKPVCARRIAEDEVHYASHTVILGRLLRSNVESSTREYETIGIREFMIDMYCSDHYTPLACVDLIMAV
jgi:hypothetical protein